MAKPLRHSLRLLRLLGYLAGLVAFLIIAGSLVFRSLEHVDFLDALYSVVMVMTGIGSNYDPHTTEGKWFNIVLSIISVGILITVLQRLFQITTVRNLFAVLQRERIKRMRDHTIFCGTSHTLHELLSRLPKGAFVVIVKTPEEAHRLERDGMHALVDDFTCTRALLEAGIEHACLLIACSEDDADNAFCCLTAKQLRRDLPVIVRISREENREKMQEVKADAIISPARLAAEATLKAMQDLRTPATT